MTQDEQFMAEALQEAEKGRDTAAPNPVVGALIVENGHIVARGFHRRPGEAHAEINALMNLGRAPGEGAVLYVTLEPCSTQGRTGACTDALISSGISTVVLGAVDPNPAHNGRGIAILKNAGIDVVTGILENECRAMNLEFNHRMQQVRH